MNVVRFTSPVKVAVGTILMQDPHWTAADASKILDGPDGSRRPAAFTAGTTGTAVAEVEITGAQGRRSVKADDFFKGLFETAIGPHDVLTAIRLPAATGATRTGFAEFTRRHGDYAVAGLAACAQANGKGLQDVRLAYFGVGATPVRARKAEAALADGGIDDAVKALADDLDPADDVQASAAVKRHLAGVLLRRVGAQLSEKPA